MYRSTKYFNQVSFVAVVIVVLLTTVLSYGFKVREELNGIEAKEFSIDEVYISQTQVPLSEIINQLLNKDEWSSFISQHQDAIVYFDPRSARPVMFLYPYPIIPGMGEGNHVTLESLSTQLGYPVNEVTKEIVKDVLMQHLKKFNKLIRINLNEIGEIRINQISDTLWHAHFRRQVDGIPVRDATIAFAIKHGNLVLWGLEKWGDINISTKPNIDKETAVKLAFKNIGGKLASDVFTARPHLEIIPLDPKAELTVGKGYDYALVWVFSFQREGYFNNWEFVVDAHTGKVISFLDKNLYSIKKIVGAIYPISSDECCPDGCASANTPAPFINTGMASPNDYTDFGGMYNYVSGTATTTLDGKYVTIGTDNCGVVSESSSTGDIDLGGANGQHDCTVPSGHSAGDTFSSRSCAIEVTHLNRQVASWLGLGWLDTAIQCNVNISSTCNAYYSANTINFYRSGSGCRNTGEIAAVFDHEWGHGVDYNDTGGGSSPNEAIADLSAAKRLQTSCIGRGFFWTLNRGCGQWMNCPSNPGVSYGYNCNGYSSSTECCLECTGIREVDYMKHADTDADTIANFTCSICTSGSYLGPCGREAHCEGIPPAMAGWDLAAYDLEAAPFNLDKQTSFLLADKIIWQGHDNVVNWYSCTCPNASGCGATNAHTNWLVADDDDGDVNNGTPHASAIYAAMNRHGIACTTLPQTNSGCSGGPSDASTLTTSSSNNSVFLSWTAVSGAANYYVWRTEGALGCDFGKVKIATVSTTSFTDTQALNGRTYYYTVQAVGSNSDCLGPLSNCSAATPVPCESCAAYLLGSATILSITGGDGDEYLDNCESADVQVTIQNIGSGTALNTQVTITSGSPFLDITTPMPINVGDIPVGGTVNATFSFTVGASSSKAACMENGVFNITVQSTGQDPAAEDTFGFTHEIDILFGNVNWPFETSLDGWTVEQGTWALSTNQVNPGDSTHSAHSSDTLDKNCDIMISPELEVSDTTELHTPNWYDIEPQSSGYWYDRANVWVVQGTTETVISPTSGKAYVSGTFYDWPSYCNQTSDKPGWAGVGTTWGDSVFDLSTYQGQKLRLRIKYMTDDLSHGQGVYLDDMYITNVYYQGCDEQSDVCSLMPELQPYNGLKPIIDDSASPKHNGIFEPNENASLVGTLENVGALTATSVSGTLTTSDSTITITDANASYPDIIVGGHQTCTDCYAVQPQATRPSTHWDFTVTENASATGYGPVPFAYTYHVGESFTDVPISNVFYSFIETLLHSGVTAGCTATQYCPLNNVQRQAMGKFICVAMENSSPGSCPTTACSGYFNDVPASNPFCTYIEGVYYANVVNGCQTDPPMYCPTNYTARQAMAKFICKGMEAAQPGSCPTAACSGYFNDVPASNPFCTYIEGVYYANVVNGCQTDPPMFCPTNNVTRQQMAKFLVNAFGFTL